MRKLLTAGAPLVEHSSVVVRRLSCSVACGVFPDEGLNWCALPWQVEFLTIAPSGKSESVVS